MNRTQHNKRNTGSTFKTGENLNRESAQAMEKPNLNVQSTHHSFEMNMGAKNDQNKNNF